MTDSRVEWAIEHVDLEGHPGGLVDHGGDPGSERIARLNVAKCHDAGSACRLLRRVVDLPPWEPTE